MRTLLVTICLTLQVTECTWYSDQCVDINSIWEAYTPSVLRNQLANDRRANLNLYDNQAKSNLFLLTQSYSKKSEWSQADDYCKQINKIDFVQYPNLLKCVGCVWRISNVAKISFHSVGFLEEYAMPLKKKWIKSGYYHPTRFLIDLILQLISVFKQGFFYTSFKVENIGLTHHTDFNQRRFTLINVKNVRRICKKDYFSFAEKLSIKVVVHGQFFNNLTPSSCMILNLYHLMVTFDILKTNLLTQMDKKLKKINIKEKQRYELVRKQNQMVLTSMLDQRNQILKFIMLYQFENSGSLVSKLDELKNYLSSSSSSLAKQIGVNGVLSNLGWMDEEIAQELTGLQGLSVPTHESVIKNLAALDDQVNDVLANHSDQIETGLANLNESVLLQSDTFDINLSKVGKVIEFAQNNYPTQQIQQQLTSEDFDALVMSENKGNLKVRNMVVKSKSDVMSQGQRRYLLPHLEQVQQDFKTNQDDSIVRTMANLARKTFIDLTDPSVEEDIESTHDFTDLYMQIQTNIQNKNKFRVLI